MRAYIDTQAADQTGGIVLLRDTDLAAVSGGAGNVHDACIGTVIKWGVMNLGYIALTHNGGTILITR